MSTVWRGDELTIGQHKVNIRVEHKMNTVFNPMSTTIVCSVALLHRSRCSIYLLPLAASRHRQRVCGFIRPGFVCVWENMGSAATWITLRQSCSWTCFERAQIGRSGGKMWRLLWRVGLMIIVSLPWQMRLKSSRYVKLGLARSSQSTVKK